VVEASSEQKAAASAKQHVEGFAGSDSNDGRSAGTAKLSVASALAQLPNGGPVELLAGDPYNVAATLSLAGHSIGSLVRGPGATKGVAVLRHNFNGNLVSFGALGGLLRNVHLYQDASATGRTGAAIHAASSASNGGSLTVENVEISGGDGWERCVVLDGSAWAVSGIRKCEFVNLHCFGARTAEETIVITRGVYCTFHGGFVVPAPTAVTQGIKVLDTGSTAVKFLGFSMIGNFYTEAAGDPLGVLYVGDISGNVVCSASARRNIFIGNISGTFDNGGDPSNIVIGRVGGEIRTPDITKTQTWTGLQTMQGGVDVTGIVGGSAALISGIRRLKMAGASQAGNIGLVEAYDRLAVSANHALGSYPDPGGGVVYANAAVAVGNGAASSTMAKWRAGDGSPEGVVTGNVGDLWSRLDGGATTTLYVKTSGTGNTGWTAK
jgi:hypothetical protein